MTPASPLSRYMETLPGCPKRNGEAHRFVYGQMICFECGRPVEAALAERLMQVEFALEKALDGLTLIRDNAGGEADPIYGARDQAWCAGVAMSAVASVEEWLP